MSRDGNLPQRWNHAVATPMAATWLAIVMLAAIGGLAFLIVWQSYKGALEAGEARAKSSAQVVAAHIEWMVEASDQALRRIDVALGDDPIRISAGAITDIRQAVGDLPSGFQYSVYDETAHLRLSSVREAIGVEVSDREYFQRLRDGEPVVISPQLKERLSGEQVFVIARRIVRNGRFHGAASIAIPTRTLDEFWRTMELGPHSTVAVIRTDGWLVARHPQLAETIDLGETPLFTRYLPETLAGFYHSAVSPADGLSRIVGYRKVDNWPLVATTGVERSETLQYFWLSLWSGLAIGVPVIGLLVLGTVWIVRLLRADAARRIELEQALERNQFLLREVHHRVKNNLQAVSSLVQLQPLPKESKEDMTRRIKAMTAVHEQIYGSDQFDRVELAPYAERLVRDIAAGFSRNVDIETRLEPVSIGRDRALSVGLIINEIVSNAFKHAFADRDEGRLYFELAREGEGARLTVKDDGPGYTPGSSGKGMGSRLIAGFVAQLGGAAKVENAGGTTVTVTFPTA